MGQASKDLKIILKFYLESNFGGVVVAKANMEWVEEWEVRNGDSKCRKLTVMESGDLVIRRELSVEGDFVKGPMQLVRTSIWIAIIILNCLVFCSSTERQDAHPPIFTYPTAGRGSGTNEYSKYWFKGWVTKRMICSDSNMRFILQLPSLLSPYSCQLVFLNCSPKGPTSFRSLDPCSVLCTLLL